MTRNRSRVAARDLVFSMVLALLAFPAPRAWTGPPVPPEADLLACPPSDQLDMYWLGADVHVRRAGTTLDKNRVYSVEVASEIPSARKPLVPVVENLAFEAAVESYGAGPDLVFYEMVSVCGSPEEESPPD